MFTIASIPNSLLETLRATLKRNGVILDVLGSHVKRAADHADEGEFGFKKKYVSNEELSPDDAVLFFDAYDTYFNGEPEKLLETFITEFKTPIVFGAERRLAHKALLC